MGALSNRFWEKPLAALNHEEWEALCDGCGKCCLHKVEEAETGRIYPTNVACRLLDTHAGRCCNYKGRRSLVPDCLRLSPKALADIEWLPRSCAYKLRAAGEPLPDWHYLISGDRETVHQGHSVRGWTVSEVLAGDLEDHIVDHEI